MKPEVGDEIVVSDFVFPDVFGKVVKIDENGRVFIVFDGSTVSLDYGCIRYNANFILKNRPTKKIVPELSNWFERIKVRSI